MFPSRSQRFVHLSPEQTYRSVIHTARETLHAEIVGREEAETLSAKARLAGALGVSVNIRVFPEGAESTLELSFSYKGFLFAVVALLVAVVGVSMIGQTAVPGIGVALILPLAYRANSAAWRFLDAVNETLPHLEREHARKTLMEDRERWRLEPKDIEDLHRRLREKHIKTWGNTNILDYKLAEYQEQGLTRNEAIRKTAEEEGIH